MKPLTVKQLEVQDCAEAVEVLSLAFHDYPVMRWVLDSRGEEYELGLRLLVELFIASRFPRGHPVLGLCSTSGELIGVAGLDPPVRIAGGRETEALEDRSMAALGDAPAARLAAFGEAEDHLVPSDPHYYLGMLGVLPGRQGKGLARQLLDAVHELSRRDPASRGVALTTELRRNVALYEHFGYRLSGRIELDGLITWGFFRPDEEGEE